MTTWHRIDSSGIPIKFTYTADERGNVTLTTQEVEGLLRAGGWEPELSPRTLPQIGDDLTRLGAAGSAPTTTAARHFAHALSRR